MGLFARLFKASAKAITKLAASKGSQQPAIKNPQINTYSKSSQPANIPDKASHRINSQKQIGNNFFTSDLTCNEYLLTREAGCEPIGVVMGTCFYKVGFFGYFRGYQNFTGELAALTQAQLAVRELAVSRMQQEAAMLGAQGIIGVRLKKSRSGWGIGMVEFTAIGTAIRIPGRLATSKPFTSDLSGQEFWQLQQAGYYPKGLVFGACSYYVHSSSTTRMLMNPSAWNRLFGQGRRNQELTQFTQGFQDARELALMRLTEDIRQLGAVGAVGMDIQTSEETITYQPWSFLGCFIQLFFFGLFITSFGLMVNGNAVGFALLSFMVPAGFIQSFVNNFRNTGPFRDLLTNFVAIGTAIVEDQIPAKNSATKTLIFIPLSK
jgi:uncharacterized protein YbjQ (UPF0145 family)